MRGNSLRKTKLNTLKNKNNSNYTKGILGTSFWSDIDFSLHLEMNSDDPFIIRMTFSFQIVIWTKICRVYNIYAIYKRS